MTQCFICRSVHLNDEYHTILMITILYIRSSLQPLVITTVIKAPAFTIAEGCTSGTSTVAFVPSCTCPDAAKMRENGTCE